MPTGPNRSKHGIAVRTLMPDQRWSVVVVPLGAGRSYTVEVSRRALRWVSGIAGTLAVAGLVFGYVALSRSIDHTQLERLQSRNELLRQELNQARTLIASLGDTVAALTERHRQVRLLAGLEPTNADVLLAGVGGPAGVWTEREQILSEGPTGRLALEARAELDALIRRATLLAGSYQEAVESLAVHVDRLHRTPSIMPISPTAGWITSNFSRARMHPIYHEARRHEGIDIFAPIGTPILAPAAGRVIRVETDRGYGKMVTVDHGNGIITRYAHCSRILVRVGQWVRRGERIALVGNTGITTGSHLHYEVVVNGQAQNPLNFIFADAIVD